MGSRAQGLCCQGEEGALILKVCGVRRALIWHRQVPGFAAFP